MFKKLFRLIQNHNICLKDATFRKHTKSLLRHLQRAFFGALSRYKLFIFISFLILTMLPLLGYIIAETDQPVLSSSVVSQHTEESITPTSTFQNQPPPVVGSESLADEKSHFSFSQDKKYIAFVQNVFAEYNYDWKKYWALKIFEPGAKIEKTLVVDDTKMSSYGWLNKSVIRLYHSAGTGVRVYLDVPVNREAILFTKDYQSPDPWTLDEEYIEKVKSDLAAERIYYQDVPD